MNRIPNTAIIFIVAMSISLIVGVTGFIGMMDERDTKITQLQNRVIYLDKLLQTMNVAYNKYDDQMESEFNAIRQAEQDNYTMKDQISTHCFFKITGKNTSKENCYGTNIIDERINACMWQHNVISFQLGEVQLTESANRSSCTEMVGEQR